MKRATTKWLIIAAIGFGLSGGGAGALASSDSPVTLATAVGPEIAGLGLEARGVETARHVGRASDPGADSFDPYTCAAAYGDTFCAAFQQCMAKQGFNACYERMGQ